MKKPMRSAMVCVFFFFSLASAAASPASAGEAAFAPKLRELGFTLFQEPVQVADFELPGLNGDTTKLSAQGGRVVLLNFWATWCPPCRAEMPAIESLWRKSAGGDFIILGVSVGEEAGTVKSFIEKNGYSYPILLDRKSEVSTYFGASSIPLTILIDKTGRAVAYVVGDIENRGGKAFDSAEMMAAIKALGTSDDSSPPSSDGGAL